MPAWLPCTDLVLILFPVTDLVGLPGGLTAIRTRVQQRAQNPAGDLFKFLYCLSLRHYFDLYGSNDIFFFGDLII